MRYAISVKSYIDTDGVIQGHATNTFNAVVSDRQEAGLITLRALNFAAGLFRCVTISGDTTGVEIHMTAKLDDYVLVTIDAEPVRRRPRRLPG